MKSPVAVLLAGAALLGPAMAGTPESKTFRSWVAGCDNLQGCAALSLPAETAENVAYLKLERPGGPSGQVSLALRVRAAALKAPLAARLSLDGAPFPAPGKTLPATVIDEENASVAIPAADAEALIAAARKATKLTVSLAGKSYDSKSYDVSLEGSVAAMLWIDEQQGRLNTTSALIRKGPATDVPPIPTMPVVLARPTESQPELDAKAARALTGALRQHLEKTDPDACGETDDALPDSVWPLGPSLRLVGLVCSRGAYYVTAGFWTVPGDDVARASKAAFPQIGGSSDNVLTNADYDPKTGQISYFAKARGLGDCGVAGGYAWNGAGSS
jgi:hypothetical protein